MLMKEKFTKLWKKILKAFAKGKFRKAAKLEMKLIKQELKEKKNDKEKK